MAQKRKQESLGTARFIQEILVGQLSIPSKQIVNDTSFEKYTGSKRPDLLISEIGYDRHKRNDDEYIANLVAYSEVKDECSVDDKDWQNAFTQGKDKGTKLKLPFFIITNLKTTIFYNIKTEKQISLNGNPIREFQTIDILRLIKTRLVKNPDLDNIQTNVDSLSIISEAVFNKKLWDLEKVYRNINFDNNNQKIDFTIGFISLEFFEEKEIIMGRKNANKIYWSTCTDGTETYPAEKIVANLSQYVERLEKESQFS